MPIYICLVYMPCMPCIYALYTPHVPPPRPAGVGSGTRRFRSTPAWLHGGELHPYQLEGLNWLFHKWGSQENVILADEVPKARGARGSMTLCVP